LQDATSCGNGDRATRELDAVAKGAEHATQQILDAAEAIEDAAGTLAASVKRKQAQALSQDIQEHVVRIFEACNFQDLGGQRINKVMATLVLVADHLARMMDICGGNSQVGGSPAPVAATSGAGKLLSAPINGPQLAGDAGHATQAEIDRIMAAE
jgi:chemotaxis protein CheZ